MVKRLLGAVVMMLVISLNGAAEEKVSSLVLAQREEFIQAIKPYCSGDAFAHLVESKEAPEGLWDRAATYVLIPVAEGYKKPADLRSLFECAAKSVDLTCGIGNGCSDLGEIAEEFEQVEVVAVLEQLKPSH
jgi:hypothetical protein